MAQFWVIDASVLGVANNLEHPQCTNAIELLNRLGRMASQIALNNEIEAEYWRRSAEVPGGLGTQWWYSMRQSNKLRYMSQRVPGRIRRELLSRRFHDDDYKYVAAALSVSTRDTDDPVVCIVQEDREDFARIADLLSDNSIRLATIEDAIQIIDAEGEHA